MGRPAKNLENRYFKLRLTLPDNCSDELSEKYVTTTAELICGTGLQAQLQPHTIGLENGWKTGKPHIHLHMRTTHSDSNLRKTIIPKILSILKDTRKLDNSIYSLKQHKETDIENLDRFFRYPLKECGLKYKELCQFPFNWRDETEISYMARLAVDEAQNKHRDIQKTEEREEAKEAKKAEIILHMEELHKKKPFTNLEDIFTEVVEYYKVENETINLDHSYKKSLWFLERFKLTTCRTLVQKFLEKRT